MVCISAYQKLKANKLQKKVQYSLIVTFCDFLLNFRNNTTKNSTKPENTPLIVTLLFHFL